MRKAQSLGSAVLITITVLLSCCVPLAALPRESTLEQKYKDKQVMLRHFYCGKDLKFDSQIRLVSGGAPGPWTLCRNIRIHEVKLEHGKLRVAGQRVYLFYDSMQKQFRDVMEVTEKSRRDNIASRQKTSIEVELPGTDEPSIQAAMDRLFYLSEDEFLADAPLLWKTYLISGSKPRESSPAGLHPGGTPQGPQAQLITSSPDDGNEKFFHIGNGVTVPKPLYQPDPDFSEDARSAGYHGTLALRIIIDREGNVQNPRITKCLGMGLDEKAAEKVLQWRFRPAMKNGEPVPVEVSAEVSFKLY